MGKRKEAVLYTAPTFHAFPPECSTCGCCGHNARGHDAFMCEFSFLRDISPKSWIVNQVQHRCLWCHNYDLWLATLHKHKSQRRRFRAVPKLPVVTETPETEPPPPCLMKDLITNSWEE
jgi:hypothetical protein